MDRDNCAATGAGLDGAPGGGNRRQQTGCVCQENGADALQLWLGQRRGGRTDEITSMQFNSARACGIVVLERPRSSVDCVRGRQRIISIAQTKVRLVYGRVGSLECVRFVCKAEVRSQDGEKPTIPFLHVLQVDGNNSHIGERNGVA